MDQPWTRRSRPDRLERRIEFEDYSSTREFLEQLSELSERHGLFPDISFGRTYVNLTLRPGTEGNEVHLSQEEETFAAAIDALLL